VEEMLIEDDNLRHIIHELDTHLAERSVLRNILEGRKITFSRNDPVLASLEMIGAIRPVQPCEVRNRIYERALQRYYQGDLEAAEPRPEIDAGLPEDVEAMYARLRALRRGALDASGAYRHGKPWETFAAALFSMVPGFSVYPHAGQPTGISISRRSWWRIGTSNTRRHKRWSLRCWTRLAGIISNWFSS